METLVEKLHIMKGSSAHESVDLDSLTNFPQVIMPPKFKAPEFVKYDGTGTLARTCACSVQRWLLMGISTLCFARFFLV